MVFVHNKFKIFMVREKLQQYEVKKKKKQQKLLY